MNGNKLILLLIFSCLNQMLFAQYEINIEAYVFNKENGQPIPYVNIGFKGKTIKTITDKNGKFTLAYDEDSVKQSDVLQFSVLGYKTQEVEASRFYRFLNNTNKIYLIPEAIINSKIIINGSQGNIFGKIMSKKTPIQGAVVKLKNTFTEVQTDVNGYYNINAKEKDILIVSFLGMKTKEIHVSSKKEIDIQLEPDGELLDEVLLEGKVNNDELIDLGQGVKKSFDAIGTSVNVITEKDIKPHYYNLDDLLNGKFAALNHSREGSINNNLGTIYDLDGMIFVPSAKLQMPFVDPQNIESLTILTSLAATTKYGTLGRGGVIVIRTKTFGGAKAETKQPSALATGNDYAENLKPLMASTDSPPYLQALQNTKTYEEAKGAYSILKQDKEHLSIPFYINAAEYFLKWDSKYALDILSYVEDLAKDNAKALKTLAFEYEALNKLDEARLVYQRIATLRPADAQSYRDLALIYTATGYYSEAMQLYRQMLSNGIENVDFSGLQQPIMDELMHLLAFHRSEVDYRDLPADLLTAKFKQDIRIVFEWNEPSAEFELQFVNPQKKFYTWSHTKFDSRERMLDEIKKGYTTEANIIDDAEAGEWIINIETFNEEHSINPNYLKYTIYKNYGLANETKTVKVIQLQSIKQKVTLDKFMYQ